MSKLVPCKGCQEKVHQTAKTCPNCGIKDPGITTKMKAIASVGLLALIGASYVACSESPQERAARDEACKKDIHCIADRNMITAMAPCKEAIEAKAHGMITWNYSSTELIFHTAFWGDVEGTQIRFVGNQASIQRVDGSTDQTHYSCTWNPDTKSVTDSSIN